MWSCCNKSKLSPQGEGLHLPRNHRIATQHPTEEYQPNKKEDWKVMINLTGKEK